ncbi:uncharacterized protein LOC122950759 [Acropora millepora]|uniref:uncharacterized protein LOC122950759 n=1 Tax=Acropora millepora TaxID=45264 RepID=UPI001CF1A336|nr:uncharacterized protein LOC122950759 [Acropora millepora]
MLGANVLAFLIPVVVLVATVFSPTEVFGANRKLHLKKPSKHLLEISDSGPKRSTEQNSFSQRLFDEPESQKIRNLTKETAFITGMESGLLNANYYGAYMVQDIAYLANGAEAYKNAADLMKDEFKTFYTEMATKWGSEYLKPMLTAWHLKDAGNVEPGTAAKEYMSFLITVSRGQPKYLAIAMLPCSMLWRWMADQLVDSVLVDSAYYSWFADNKSPSPGYKGSLERFVDANFDQEEFDTAKPFFCKAMVHECSFFSEGGNQTLCDLPPGCA